jgi:hypothetical protein
MHKTDLLPGADAPRRVGDSHKSDSGVCAYMANIRRKDFIAGGASEFEISTDNSGLYIFIALALIGFAGALL